MESVCDSNIHRSTIMCLIFILCSALSNGGIPILQRMREQHETDVEDEEDSASGDADDSSARQYFYFNLVHIAPDFVCEFPAAQRQGIFQEILHRWQADARAQVGAEDFFKPNKPVLCAAHVIGMAAPAMYGHTSYQATELPHRELRDQS